MSRFLFVIVEGGGNVAPQVGIAGRLARRGHTVRVLGDPAIEPEVRAVGCELAPFQRAPHQNMRDRARDPVQDWAAKSPIAALQRIGEHLMFGPAERYARDLLDEVDRFRPDALAVDMLPLGAIIGAEKSGLPTAILQHTILQRPIHGIPPFGTGFVPSTGVLARWRDRALWSVVSRTVDRLGLRTINAAREALQLAPVAHVIEQMGRATRVLVLASRAFDYAARVVPEGVSYVGAQLDDPAWTAPWTPPWGDDAAQPLILASLGSTYQGQEESLRRVTAALGELPVRGLVTLGDVFAPSEVSAPPNVVVVRSAPHRAVLPRARAVVTHGGHGTVMKALAAGLPIVCIPLGRDQKDVAARVVGVGAGLSVGRNASVAQLRRAIGRVLAEPRFTDGARKLAEAVAADDARDRAVEELEALPAALARKSDMRSSRAR